MKTLKIAAVLTAFFAGLAFLPANASAIGNIKVLILDKGFDKMPEDKEKLVRLDSTKGILKIGDAQYYGNIDVFKGRKGIYLINEIPLEDYVAGVVKAETAKDWAEQALMAQAIIVRTYVINHMMKNKEKPYHITSSVQHQLFKGTTSDQNIKSAVAKTRGMILTYEGEPIEAYYHSTTNGMTEVPEEVFGKSLPYLKSVKATGSLSPLSMWTRLISIKEIENAMGVTDMSELKVKARTETGRAKEIGLISCDEGGEVKHNHTVAAQVLRKTLGWKRLPSTDFTVRMDGDSVLFEGKGYGHGIGLCQWTAQEMALNGSSYNDILQYFYNGTSITFHEDF